MAAIHKLAKWERVRQRAMRRDEYLCQECKRFGKSTEAREVHHRMPVETAPELAFTAWNLISLCHKCHNAMHVRATHELTELGNYWAERVSPRPNE